MRFPLVAMDDGSIHSCRGIGEKRLDEIRNFLAAPEVLSNHISKLE